MDILSRHGRDGIPIPGFGLAAPILISDSALESAGSAVLAGDGVIGDSTGITITRSITTAGISPAAERFITATISIAVVESDAGESTTVLELRPDHSMETGRQLEDMLSPVVRAASARVHLADMGMADRRGIFRRADGPASGAERMAAEVMAAEVMAVDITDPRRCSLCWKTLRME